ncbi:SusC/RagA family TonB-linked outer membrane protein [Porphyromonas macacae]|uniref:SusC/RagA family TonB-linked outer membrane protein n=1 Tax=Porphyromonas macacae TaxID=28115 RepID=UPI0024AE34C6|nr:SusC/RagA family TonB-linked outer membrane protein [Porphyromonas macacae]
MKVSFSSFKKSIALMATLALLSMGGKAFANIPGGTVTTNQQSPTITVKGSVVDEQKEPLIGVSILVKGTAIGVQTDVNGEFTLTNISRNAVLVVSYIGMRTQEVAVNGQTNIHVVLKSESVALKEVVVTALGIKREKKALGYAMQEVKGEELLKGREPNITNSLIGKFSGVQIIRSSNGPGGSSKIVLRGHNSLTGNNQPLIVVDGVPMDNFTGTSGSKFNSDYWNPDTDMGNGLSDINPEDVANITILKGGSAAALYGSRAGNGVIQITTKTGRKNKGLGLTISSSVSFTTLFMKPELQSVFGQGSNGVYDKDSGSSWGPKIAGQEVEKWNGEKTRMQVYDNVKNYFNTGVNFTENISFSQQYGKTSVYTSVTQTNDKSNIPGAKLGRTNMMARAVNSFGPDDRWTTDTKVQYIRTSVQNRPLNGKNSSNTFLQMYLLPRTMDIRDFKDAIKSDGTMLWYGSSGEVNPYWASRYNLNHDTRDRFLLNASLKYKFTDWLTGEIRAGSDLYSTETWTKTYAGSPIVDHGGRFTFGQERFYENNYSFLFTASKDNLWEELGVNATFGGNMMDRKYTSIRSNSGALVVPNLFTLNNGVDKPTVNNDFNRKKINSFYGSLQLNWGGYFFLDGTLRNDWSSSLHKDNRSFLYPSISTSWVITDMLRKSDVAIPGWINFLKVRGSFAQVGNDLPPYQLYNNFEIGKDGTGGTMGNTGGTFFDPNVKNELISSWEFGTEVRLFDNRLGIDFAWYKSNARNQLLDLPIDPGAGFNNKKINAGDIQNRGFEFMINADLIRNRAFTWNAMLNLSRNENKIISLYGDIKEYTLGQFQNVRILAIAGGNYGEIWGSGYKRVEDEKSEHYGRIVVDENGLPLGDDTSRKLGDQQAKVLLGLTNSFSYAGFNLSFLIDARLGGKIYSATNRFLQSSGSAAATVINGDRKDFIVDGVVEQNGKFVENKKEVSVQDYWGRVLSATNGNLGITEANIYDASTIRLRNITLNYALPNKWLAKTKLTKASVGFSCNNVWMLSSHLNGVDPESVFSTGSNAVGFEFSSSPTSSSYMFNVTLGF